MSHALNRIVDTIRKIQKYGSNKARSFNNATCAETLRALLVWTVFLGIARVCPDGRNRVSDLLTSTIRVIPNMR